MQKESVRCILIKIKCFFSNFKEFYNEQGYISYFNFIFCFHKFNTFPHIRSFPIIRFNICFFLNIYIVIYKCPISTVVFFELIDIVKQL